MKVLSGAIVTLAGAVVLGAAVLGTEVSHAAGRMSGAGASAGSFAGIVLLILGAFMLARGWASEKS